jgi:hypothetical protein
MLGQGYRQCIKITNSIEPIKCKKTVIYATNNPCKNIEGWNCIQVPESFYYSEQFREAIKVATEDILLIIVGDISYSDWRQAVATCAQRYDEHDRVGVWGATDPTSLWERPGVHIAALCDGLDVVAQTDCSVWAISRPIYERLKNADYSRNKYGWGIDWLAISHGYSLGLLAVRDKHVVVNHPTGTGYDEKEARKQMMEFIEQMSSVESVYYTILTKYVSPIMPWGDRPGAID